MMELLPLELFQTDMKWYISRKGAHKATIGIIPKIPDKCEGKTTHFPVPKEISGSRLKEQFLKAGLITDRTLV